jgi:general secretion pathway protein L
MPDSLIVRLPREADSPASWIIVNAQGLPLQQPRHGPLAEAAADATGRRVIALAPAADVLLAEAVLPPKAGAKTPQVIAYALEDQVADDIDALHFALGRRAANGSEATVAVVSKTLLGGWVSSLRAAGLEPEALYPESQLVPANPGQVVAWLDADVLSVRSPEGRTTSIPVDSLPEAFELLGVAAAEQALLLCAPTADWQRHAGALSGLQQAFGSVKVQLLTQGSLAWLASQLPAAQPINLLQGELTPNRTVGFDAKRWRLPAGLAAALLLTHVGGNLYEARRLAAAERTLNDEIAQVFRAAMPGAIDSTNARERMAQRLAAVQGGGGSGGLLPALAALASARANAPGSLVRGLTFRDGMLELRMTAPDAAALDRIAREVATSGFKAEITSGAAAGDAYEGRLRIATGAA